MILYIRDLFYAIWAWLAIWKIPKQKLERRIRFVDDALDDERKKRLPYKLLKAVYNKRLKSQEK